MSVGVALGMLSHGLRSLAGIQGGDPSTSALEEWARRIGLEGPLASVAALMRVPGHADPSLEAARADPSVLSERLREAAADVFGVLGEPNGVVLVLEDMQWADPSTLSLVDWRLDMPTRLPQRTRSAAGAHTARGDHCHRDRKGRRARPPWPAVPQRCRDPTLTSGLRGRTRGPPRHRGSRPRTLRRSRRNRAALEKLSRQPSPVDGRS